MNPFPTTLFSVPTILQHTERINPFPTRMRRKLSSALMYGEANTVYSNIPNRATRDICIRRCGNAPLKIDRGRIVWYNKVLEIFKAVKECSE